MTGVQTCALPIWGNAREDMNLRAMVRSAVLNDMRREFEALAFSTGLDAWIKAVFACNAYIDEMAPWALRKTDPARMAEVLGTLYRCIADLAIGLLPIAPESARRLLAGMGLAETDWNYGWIADGNPANPRAILQPTPLFPRLELPAEVAA